MYVQRLHLSLSPAASAPDEDFFFRTAHVILTRERECLTDNVNRTVHQIREILNEHKCVLSSFLSSL